MDAAFPGYSTYTPSCWTQSGDCVALQAGPRLWGERGTKRDLLSPCQPRPSMIADLLTDGEDLADDFPCSVKREQMSGHPFSPAHLRDVSPVLIMLLSCSA